MQPLFVQTPLWHSSSLSALAGIPVYLKMEALQPVGSFKARGMGSLCQKLAEAGVHKVVCSSGGNAGLATAYACRQLELEATIVVPESTSQRSRDLILGQGARLLIHGASWDDAHVYGLELAEQTGAGYVHPFDDPRIWSGHASLVTEIAESGIKPGLVAVSVGGGGLLCGVLEGMHSVGWTDVPVIAVETEGAASFAASVKAGRLVTLDMITSLATTLGARTVTGRALQWTRQHQVIPWVVTDRQAVNACLRFSSDHRILVEPACGASLSVVYDRAPILSGHDPLVVVVCGGAGVTLELLHYWDQHAN